MTTSEKQRKAWGDKPEPRDWTARRRGAIYCAPASGGGCTWEEYQKAQRSAKALCKRMKSAGWEPRINENLGWHWGIVKGGVTVWPVLHGKKLLGYFVGLEGGTPCEISVGQTFKDPNDAVRAQLALIRKVTREWSKFLTVMESNHGQQ